jgi:pilus assembly protein Flp/PilA
MSRNISHIWEKISRFLSSEDGPTAVEYAVMLSLIVVVCLTAIQAIGSSANDTFGIIEHKLRHPHH